MTRSLPLKAMQAFEASARLGSFTRAAEELHVTSSALSHQVKKLESHVGISLFLRKGNQLLLTDAGSAYLQELRQGFEMLGRAHRQLQRSASQRAVRIATLPLFAVRWLMPRIAGFYALHPDAEVQLRTSYAVGDLNDGDDHLAVRWGRGAWPDGHSQPLFQDVIVAVCSPRWKLEAATTGHVDWTKIPRIQNSATRDDWALWVASIGMKRLPRSKELVCTDPLSAIQAAIDGLGVALTPFSTVSSALDGGELALASPHKVSTQETYHLVVQTTRPSTPERDAFADWIMVAGRAHGQQFPPLTHSFAGPVRTR